MKNLIPVFSLIMLFYSCIPLRIAPNIDDYKITQGKRFKRDLPKRQMFIFVDSKEAGQFYDFVNTKFNLDDENVYDDIPFEINNKQFFFSFYETEIQDKSFQLFPIVVDALISHSLGSDDIEPIFSNEDGMSRTGNYYLALEVYSDLENDCLAENSFSRTSVLKYLRELKDEYLATNNYHEVLFKD